MRKATALLLILLPIIDWPAYADLSTGLVVHYAFSDNIEDSSSGNHDLSLQNNGSGDISYVDGPVGKALYMPGGVGGIGDRVYMPDWSGSDGFTGGFSVSVWVKRVNTTDSISFVNKSSAHVLTFDLSGDGEFRGELYDSDGTAVVPVSTGDVAEDTSWHYLCLVSNPNGAKLYLDNNEVGSATHASWDNIYRNNTNNLFFGNNTIGCYIDEYRLYKRSLSTAEVQELYEQGSGSTTATPTDTATNTLTPTITDTPTITNTPANTSTPTPTSSIVYKYVRDGGPVGASGNDWSNAYDELPSVLTRGTTYLVADGTYPGYTFNDANSGTSVITIQKATVASHGTSTGWSDTYGDGYAQFNGYIYFSTDYWVIDGAVGGGPGSWETGHGFRFDYTGWHSCHLEGARHDITLRHCDFESGGRSSTNTEDQIFYAIGGPYNITIQYCWMHDVRGCQFLTRSGHDYLIEYNKWNRNGGGGITSHREAWSGSNESDVIFRYNFLEDISNTGMIALVNGFGEASNWEIYGNVFCHSGNLVEADNQISPAVILTKYDAGITEIIPKNWKIYNNTFGNIAGNTGFRFVQVDTPGDVVARNNLFWHGVGSAIHQTDTIDIDYNYYADNQTAAGADLDVAAAAAETNSTAGTGDPFTDYASKDWTIEAAIAGVTLDATYATDAYGNTRGDDGVWDIGAYEYVDAEAPTPTPTNTVTVTPTITQTPTATPTNTGATPTATRTITPIRLKIEQKPVWIIID